MIKELKNRYKFVRQTIDDLSEEVLLANCDFAGDTIPVWRLIYAMENYNRHHRGRCVVYLSLNEVIPRGFYGW